MVIGIHRVMLLCVIVLLTGSIFGMQAAATDSRVTELANKAGIRILRDSSSDKQLQKTAAAQVPLARMSQNSKQRAIHLLKHTSQYRRMPSLQYEVDASLYQYLINHPDVAIATWRVMGISKLNMWQTAPFEYAAEADDGSKGQADVLWRDGNQCLFVVEGAYHSPLLPSAIEASALVWMRYRFERTSDNRIVVNQQIETFVNFPSPAIEVIAKMASMVTNTILDRNVIEVSLYAQMMSRAVKNDGNWVEEVAARMEGVPEYRKIELTRVARGLNPYEAKDKSRISSNTDQQQYRLAPRSVPTRTAAGTATVSQSTSNHDAETTNSALSNSKQQLLQAARSGNVLVIVKPQAVKDESKQPAEAAAVGGIIKSVSLSKTLEPATAASTKVARLSPELASKAAALSDLIASAVTSLSAQPIVNSTSEQEISASGPTQTTPKTTTLSEERNVYSGHSKDGSSKAASLNDLATGPIAQANTNESATMRDKTANSFEDVSLGKSTFVGSTGDQPALIPLPPSNAAAVNHPAVTEDQ